MKSHNGYILFEKLGLSGTVYGKIIALPLGVIYDPPLHVGDTIYVERDAATLIKDNIFACRLFSIIARE